MAGLGSIGLMLISTPPETAGPLEQSPNRGLCFFLLSGIAGLGGCDDTGKILKFKTNTQIMLL